MPQKLSPNEIRDITTLLEAGKPLPEKYRFVLFGDQRHVDLVWDGKTNAVCDVLLPFQIIEQVDEPRSEQAMNLQPSLFDMSSGRQLKGWSNKLIWGDNKFVLASLRSGPLRDEIEANGGIKLIYIDPPFDVGADFTIDVEIGDETLAKEPNVLEEIAYRDTWGRGADSFIAMIYERLLLMRDLVAQNGSIYVHCDWRVNASIRFVLNEVFGEDCFNNEIIWKRSDAHSNSKYYGITTDTIFFYGRTQESIWNQQYVPYDEDYIKNQYRYVDEKGRRYLSRSCTGHSGVNKVYSWKGMSKPWRYSPETFKKLEDEGRIVYTSKGVPRYKQFLDEMQGMPVGSLWDDISKIHHLANERLDHPTQKPEALLERIIKASSNEGDLVADFFSGSGTTAAVAEKLGRKWIVSDLGKFAIHTTRKRLIAVQRELNASGKDWRAFEILNLGKYERGLLLASHTGLESDAEREAVQRIKDNQFERLILSAYKADRLDSSSVFIGTKLNRHIVVGPVNLPVTRLFVEHVIDECRRQKLTKVDILAFEYEMGLFPNIQNEARELGVDLALKYIPRDVFDKRAVQAGQVRFHDVAYIDAKPILKGSTLSIELTEYSVGYEQDSRDDVGNALKPGGSRVVVESGQVVKLTKDADGNIVRTKLTKHWSDWVDYWALDYDFQSRKEIVNIKNPVTGEFEAKWTGDFVFENEWQTFRTKQDRKLELVSPPREILSGNRKVAIKVVDIFGNDTMKVLSVRVGK